MARRVDRLLERLENARRRRPGAAETRRLLRESRRVRLGDAEGLIRLHEAVLFLRAYPHDARVRDLAEDLLRGMAARVAALEAAERDLSAFDAPGVAGIAGTTIGTDFSFDVARWLTRRFPGRVRLDWEAGAESDRMRATWPAFLPLLEEEALADANVPYEAWLRAAAGRRSRDPAWLLARYETLALPEGPLPEDDRAEHFDALGVSISWRLPASASRTRMRLPGPAPFFHDEPFLSRRDVSLDAVMTGPPLKLQRLTRRQGEAVCEKVREATAARYREFYTFTHADPESVVAARPGRGVELFLLGVRKDRRLPLRAAYGGFVVKNGVPIGYIEGLAFLERLEIGFNMYYTFREGESAWIYAQVLRLHRDALGVTSFSIDPYQLGHENAEAIASGAFWFYRKLGFRPTDPKIRRRVEREEARIARRPEYRSSPAALRELVGHNLLYEVPGTGSSDWDRFHVRNLGLAVNRRMGRRGVDAGKAREDASRRVRRALGGRAEVPDGWALVLDLVPDLASWPQDDRRGVLDVLAARDRGRGEAGYLRRLRLHARLRAALIALGSAARGRSEA